MIYSKTELTAQWLEVYDMADDPDMDEDSWFGMMESIEGDIEQKAEATAMVMKNWEAEAEGLEKEAARLKARADVLRNKAAWSKAGLFKMMKATGKTKFKTDRFSFGIQKNGGSAPLVIKEGITANDLDPQYIKFPDPVIDKAAIREELEAGVILEFAHLGERGESLRIR